MLQIRQEFAAANESLTRNDAALRRYAWTAPTEVSQKGPDDQEGEPTTVHVSLQPLPDATNCVALTVLRTATEELHLVTQNEDYRKVAP